MTFDPTTLTAMSASGILCSDKSDAGATVGKRTLTPEQRARYNERQRIARKTRRLSDRAFAAKDAARSLNYAARKREEDPEFLSRRLAVSKAWVQQNSDRRHEIQRKYRESHKPHAAERFKARYAAMSNAERLWESARKRAMSKGLPFTITKSDIVIPATCPVLGVTLERGKGVAQANSPSLDRIDNSKGYVPENIQVVSNRANSIKRDATFNEIEALYLHMKSLRDRGVGFVESRNQT